MITASQVKELREKTGAGMMECKKVLTETDGDIEKAMELLRERGITKAAKKASRVAAEGLVGSFISEDGKVGAIAEVNAETDFVAENAIAMSVISNFISGKFNVIRNDYDRRASYKDQTGEDYLAFAQTFGMLFDTFGSARFVEFFNMLNDYIGQEVANVKLSLEALPKLNSLDEVTQFSARIQTAHSNIMSAAANIAVICAVQQMVKDFLEKFN